MNKEAKPFYPGGNRNRKSPHSLVVGSSKTFRLSIDPHPETVHGAAAAFVLYGLTKGYDSGLAASAYVSLVVLLEAAMRGQVNQLKVAPRLWWQLVNALAPKATRSKGQSIQYDWNMTNFAVNPVPNLGGVIFGPVQGGVTGGFNDINVNAVGIPQISAASDVAGGLFAVFDEAHKVMPPVDDYKFDVSAFAYKIPLVSNGGVDVYRTSYGVNAHEVPIRSFFGFCGFAQSTAERIPFRLPRFFLSSQGSALQYLGIRLHYPKMMDRRFTMTRINFRTMDISAVTDKHTKMLQFVKTKLIQAERTETSNKLLPDAYYGFQNDGAGYFIPTVNLAIVHHLLNACGGHIALAACWAGTVANGLSAMAVGTNLVVPNLNTKGTDSSWLIEEMSQIHPVFNPRNNMVHIPVPCISEDYIQYFRTIFMDYYETTSSSCPDYGGTALDLLNSTIGGNYVQLVNGPTLFEDRGNLTEIDQLYQALNPMVGAEPKISPLRIGNIVRSRLVNGSFINSADNLRKIFTFQRLKDMKAGERLIDYLADKKRVGVKAPVRTSPLVQILPVMADTSAIEVVNPQVEDQLNIPISIFSSVEEGVAAQRLIAEDTDVKLLPKDFNQIQEIQSFVVSSAYAGDANNETKTDVISVTMRNDVDPSEIIDGLDPLIDLLPPRVRMVAKVAQKVAKAVAPAVKKMVDNGRARRQRRRGQK